MKTFDPFDADQVQEAWPTLEELRRASPLVSFANGIHYMTFFECGPRALWVEMSAP